MLALRALELRIERCLVGAMRAVAESARDEAAVAALTARAVTIASALEGAAATPIDRLAARLRLPAEELDFLWTAIAVTIEPRLAVHVEALGGSAARRGVSVALHTRLTSAGTTTAIDAPGRALAHRLSSGHPLVAHGVLVPVGDHALAAVRCYAVPARIVGFAIGDDTLEPGLRRIEARPATELVFDEAQTETLARLSEILRGGEPALVVVEGARGGGRATAIAHALGHAIVAGSVATLDGDPTAAALAVRREALLSDAMPLLTDADRLDADGARRLAVFLDEYPGTIVVASRPEHDLGASRPAVRIRWPLPATATRRALWERLAHAPSGDLDALAHRYKVGPGAITRAVSSARILGQSGDALGLAAGLRHNIAEQAGSLVTRIEVTQRWSELVLSDDTRDQINALVARIRHSHQVLERWGFRGKIARGTGVAALFSGPPGTGKTMVAGLIAHELDLELYQVDLSQVVSKWIGESEKQLARVFDAAEQGHALLLFDEADALFGERSQEVSSATDRYANLEVNFLLQRVEAFGGITILTTNLDTAIDPAFKRRLAAHIVFELPDEPERALLWRRMLDTGIAPLGEIDFDRLARNFPKMSGANIRNAALSAAFLAAADGAAAISSEHTQRAARVEYRSMGHVLAERR